MNKFKPFIYILLFTLISSFLLTALNYINLLPNNIFKIIKILIMIILFFISGFFAGKISIKKGWLSGLEIGSILLIIIIILDLILKINFNYKVIIYYIILLLLSTIGSIIGINKRKS